MRPEPPLHRSLLLKLLGLTAFVLTCSIVTVAWLSAHLTAAGLSQQQGQALGDDIGVYTALVNYAATHESWAGVGPELAALARRDGRPVALTTVRGQLIADSAAGGGHPPALPAAALATIDPLNVNTTLIADTSIGQDPLTAQRQSPPAATVPAPAPPPAPAPAGCTAADNCTATAVAVPGPASDRIDPMATGPYLLPPNERVALKRAAMDEVACLKVNYGVTARIAVSPTGRPDVVSPFSSGICRNSTLDRPTVTEARALSQLTTLVNACLASQHAAAVKIFLGFGWTAATPGNEPAGGLVSSCIASGRAEQLAPYVAPAALVFVGSPQPASAALLSLSTVNRTRIVELAALVLLITMTITTVIAIRITRPLHALAGAARQASRGDFSARVTVRSHDETGIVARAFNEMAEQRQQAESQRKSMVNDIAHELRTPVSNILGWLEAAEDGLSDPAEALGSLREESLLLAHLIGDLQDLANADAGELAIRAERLDLADMLDNVAQAHRGTADAKGIRLVSRVPGELPVTADPIRLRQAVANLVSNAIRHTPADGSVLVSAWPDGDEVVIEVADTGPGIDPRHLPFLFERFWRADKSRSRQTGGSGLGLAITRKLAEAHRGTVSAANSDAGAVFTLRIPVRQPGSSGVPAGGRGSSGVPGT